jgi:hypothetical protein
MKTDGFQLAVLLTFLAVAVSLAGNTVLSQSIDRTQNPNIANAGIAKSLAEEVGAGRGDLQTPDSSAFIIARDPFRAIRRGPQLFLRKFLRSQGQGPLAGSDGAGDINTNLALGAGPVDSCAGCHGRPRGAAGCGGDVATRPESRDAPHLFGLGLKEMLADEITSDLRVIRAQAGLRQSTFVTASDSIGRFGGLWSLELKSRAKTVRAMAGLRSLTRAASAEGDCAVNFS